MGTRGPLLTRVQALTKHMRCPLAHLAWVVGYDAVLLDSFFALSPGLFCPGGRPSIFGLWHSSRAPIPPLSFISR